MQLCDILTNSWSWRLSTFLLSAVSSSVFPPFYCDNAPVQGLSDYHSYLLFLNFFFWLSIRESSAPIDCPVFTLFLVSLPWIILHTLKFRGQYRPSTESSPFPGSQSLHSELLISCRQYRNSDKYLDSTV
uniref:Uncharacterized protein n=1 Tax=Molossus molossus TaxID=27622 RepID=A0A7J8F931_MOLMO|nr:hypothetical protein HJG59_008543 [Molossus molossus]